jgi:hypothetical protein
LKTATVYSLTFKLTSESACPRAPRTDTRFTYSDLKPDELTPTCPRPRTALTQTSKSSCDLQRQRTPTQRQSPQSAHSEYRENLKCRTLRHTASKRLQVDMRTQQQHTLWHCHAGLHVEHNHHDCMLAARPSWMTQHAPSGDDPLTRAHSHLLLLLLCHSDHHVTASSLAMIIMVFCASVYAANYLMCVNTYVTHYV